DGEPFLPGAGAVNGLVEAAVAAGRPQRALGGDVDDVGVARVDDDLGDVLGLLEADVLPALATVVGAVQPVAVADAALAVVLAGADPDDLGAFRVEGEGADGVGALVVEDGGPGGAGVDGLPDAAGGGGGEVAAAVGGVDGEGGDAPGGEGRPEGAQPQPGEGGRARGLGGGAGPQRGRQGQKAGGGGARGGGGRRRTL